MPRHSVWLGHRLRDRRPHLHVMPRRLRVQHDYPRNADQLGRPVLEASRVVPLRPLFPRRRAVSSGVAHETHRWWLRSLAHYARWESISRRDRRIFARTPS